MKKYSIAFIAFISLFPSAWAGDTTVQKVYRLETYQKSELTGEFEYIGHGSAVLVWSKQVITNAHVVTDENDVPTGNYNLCISDTFDSFPECRTSMKLVKYDKTNDLAVLEPIENISLGSPVEFSSQKLELGNPVKVYGYPANGGITITMTEGKISGAEGNRYKIDANIDSGNSGGGAFSPDGKLIGVPYVASVGLSTLGYIIPSSAVRDFLDNKGDITTYGRVDSKFLKYIKKNNSAVNEQKISSSIFSLDTFGKKGFVLVSANEQPNSDSSTHILYAADTWDTTVYLKTRETYGADYVVQQVNMSNLKTKYATVLKKDNVTLWGKKINQLVAVMGEKKSDGTVDNNVFSLILYLNGATYSINTDHYKTEQKNISKALSLFVKDLKFKKILSTKGQSDYSNVAGNFAIVPGMNLEKYSGRTLFFFSGNLPQNGEIAVKKSLDGEGNEAIDKYSMEEYGSIVAKNIKLDNTVSNAGMEIRKNKNGAYYLRVKSVAKDGTVVYSDSFYSQKKKGDPIYTMIFSFAITQADAGIEQKYIDLLDSVKLEGNFPFKWATLGKITGGLSL